MGLDGRKPVFWGLLKTKAQTSLRLCAVWSAPLWLAYWKVAYLNLLLVKFQYSKLVSVAEQTGLSVSLMETPRKEAHGATTCYLFACQCCLLITFANSLDPDQALLSWAWSESKQFDSKAVTERIFWKWQFWKKKKKKKKQTTKKAWKNYQACNDLSLFIQKTMHGLHENIAEVSSKVPWYGIPVTQRAPQ